MGKTKNWSLNQERVLGVPTKVVVSPTTALIHSSPPYFKLCLLLRNPWEAREGKKPVDEIFTGTPPGAAMAEELTYKDRLSSSFAEPSEPHLPAVSVLLSALNLKHCLFENFKGGSKVKY